MDLKKNKCGVLKGGNEKNTSSHAETSKSWYKKYETKQSKFNCYYRWKLHSEIILSRILGTFLEIFESIYLLIFFFQWEVFMRWVCIRLAAVQLLQEQAAYLIPVWRAFIFISWYCTSYPMPHFLNEEEKNLRLSRRLLYTSSNYIFVLQMHTCTIGRKCMEKEVHTFL